MPNINFSLVKSGLLDMLTFDILRGNRLWWGYMQKHIHQANYGQTGPRGLKDDPETNELRVKV